MLRSSSTNADDLHDDDGATFSAGSRYTHVWVTDQAARWRLASAQGTTITE